MENIEDIYELSALQQGILFHSMLSSESDVYFTLKVFTLVGPLDILEQRGRDHLKLTTDSWRMDETYSKVRSAGMHLYHAVDSAGNTLEFVLSPNCRDQ